MTKQISGEKDSPKQSSAKTNTIDKNANLKIEDKVKYWKSIVEDLSYEDSLEELDRIMLNFQTENIQVEDLQNYYLKAKIYLAHCLELLDQVEQEVIELDTDKIDINI